MRPGSSQLERDGFYRVCTGFFWLLRLRFLLCGQVITSGLHLCRQPMRNPLNCVQAMPNILTTGIPASNARPSRGLLYVEFFSLLFTRKCIKFIMAVCALFCVCKVAGSFFLSLQIFSAGATQWQRGFIQFRVVVHTRTESQ